MELTFWQLIVGGGGIGLLVVTLILHWRATKAAVVTANIAHKDFIATHRPRLNVRFVQPGALLHDERPEAWVTFVNVGETEATITQIGSDIARRGSLDHWEPPGLHASLQPVANQTVMKSGERHTVQVKGAATFSGFDIIEIERRKKELCIIGEVQYADTLGTLRHTSFIRILEPSSNRYEKSVKPSDVEDYEYED